MVFGLGYIYWGSFLLSVLAAAYALIHRSGFMMLLGAALYAPFLWYMHLTPRFEGVMIFITFYLASVFALWIRKPLLAYVYLSPVAFLTVYILCVIW
jgi:glucose dehydrogenase